MDLPLEMTGRLADCVQLTYRTPADTVRGLLPEGLELIVRGPWAFWNVVCCRVEHLRPRGVPAFCGVTYHHVAYRLMGQAMTDRAEIIRGLYFTRSDADARLVGLLGNQLTDFRFHPAEIQLDAGDCGVRCTVRETPYAQGDFDLDAAHAPARLADGSCFPTTEDARRLCRYDPNGLAVCGRDGVRFLKMTRVQRAERAWSETPLAVRAARFGYFDAIDQSGHIQLEWACRLSPMAYGWTIGETAVLLQQPSVEAAPIRIAG